MARPGQICNQPKCFTLAVSGTGRCPAHQREPWAGRRGFEGYKGHWQEVRAQVLAEEPVCRLCGAEPSITVDHIKPKARGGTDARGNLQGLGTACKRLKDAQDSADGRRLTRG